MQNDTRAKLQRPTDPYLRDRLHDLDDLANRLLHQLTGQSLVATHDELPDNAIVVARNMGPAALLDYDRKKLRGLVIEDGGPSSHVAIIARALGIPAIGEVANIADLVEQGDAIIVDATSGRRAIASARRCRSRLCRKGAAQSPAPGAISQAARRSAGHSRRRDVSICT